jgi:tripartite-type tricarboxylate transporter receptor subunit TctC
MRTLAALSIAILAAAFDGGCNPATAQITTSRPVRVVVPFDPGGAVDVVARIVGRGLAAELNRTVIVENRPGGSTLLAAQQVARSEADGDTLLFCLDDTFTIVPHLSKTSAFSPNSELIPVNLVGKILMVLLANKAMQANNLPDMIKLAHAKPALLNYGSAGSGRATHLSMEMLKHAAKVDILHVPFRGIAPALAAVASGHVHMTTVGYGTARGMLEEDKLIKPIAVASPERIGALPNISTMVELGYPDVDATSWLAVAVPATMSADVLARVNGALTRAIERSEIRKQIEARDVVVTNIGPEPFAKEIASRSKANQEAVRISGAQQQ